MKNNFRFHGLDFSRAVFVLLGLFYHSALIFSDQSSWRVVSDFTAPLFSLIASFTKVFRMESFYVLSGFFYALLVESRRANFIKERILFLLVPMFFVGFTFNHLMNFFSFNRTYLFGFDYYFYGEWVGHLWFIGNLAVYYLVFFPFVLYFVRSQLVVNDGFFFLAVFSVSFVATFFKVLIPHYTFLFVTLNNLFYFFPYFLLGVLFFKRKDLFFNLISLRLCMLFIFSYCVIWFFSLSFFSQKLLSGVEHLARVFVVLGSIGLLNYIGRESSILIRGIVSSSYTVYLLHQPIIVLVFALIFVDSTINIYLMYFTIVFSSFFIPYALHRFFVSNSRVLKFLFNGKLK